MENEERVAVEKGRGVPPIEKKTLQKSQLMGLPGFEPGSFPRKASANTLREPESPSLDQASRQPPPRLHQK